ncbi:MAG: M15 family metallopeptidase [Flavobacteriales bacterium]
MNRNTFIKTSFLGSLGMLGWNSLMSFQQFSIYSENDLIGKGKIPLEGNGYKLRKEASEQFLAMKKAAAKEGFNIYSVSSFRSYDRQNTIWTRKYKRFQNQGFSSLKSIEKIIEYSTIPGTSRHHWGTDLDIVDAHKKIPSNPLNAKHFEKHGIYYTFKQWLNENSTNFGFYEVYTNDVDRKGFKYEPWHFSYQPLAKIMLEEYKKMDIKLLLQKNNLIGSDYFTDEFIEKYTKENILDINKKLL